MTLVSASIPNLVNGVSQQAYTQRLASQAEEQVNFLSAISGGLTRRAPSKHLAKIADAPYGKAALHLINRDQTERYIVAIADGDLKVFDLMGDEKTVHFENDDKSYLVSTQPDEDFRAVSVADYTFILNRNQQAALTEDKTVTRPKEALVNVKQGNYGRDYRIEIDGVERAAYSTPDGGSASHSKNIDTVFIATELENDLQTAVSSGDLTGFTITRHQNAIHIVRDTGDFSVAVEDGFNGFAMSVAKDQLQRFSDLPNFGPDGFQVEIVGDPGTAFDNYYVRFEKSDSDDSAGVWRETVAQDVKYKLDAAKMPHVLVRLGDLDVTENIQFEFRRAEWEDREVGDDESAPHPSFIGRKLNDIFFFRNRHGVLSDENVILSRAGQFFNFWPKTVTAQVDSDPIDVAGSHNRVSILRHATPFNRSLLLFSDQTQFMLEGGDTLAPSNASIRATTEFVSSSRAKPVGSGRHVYFVTEKGGYAGVREYTVEDAELGDAAENTKHAASYIPDGVFSVAAAGHDNLLALLTEGAPNAIYIYKFYWSRDDKLQSSWSRWVFGANDRILAAEFADARLILIIERADGVYLEEMDLDPSAADPGFDFEFGVDRRIDETVCTLSLDTTGGETATNVTLPYDEPEPLWVIAREDGALLSAGEAVPYTRIDDATVRILGDVSAEKLFIGRRYQSRYQFSPFILREQQGAGGASAIGEGRLQILYLAVFYEESGSFEVQVTPKARDPYLYSFTGKVLAAVENAIDATPLASGRFKLPVYARNTEVAVEIQTDGFLPARFVAAEWEGRWVLRSRRMT